MFKMGIFMLISDVSWIYEWVIIGIIFVLRIYEWLLLGMGVFETPATPPPIVPRVIPMWMQEWVSEWLLLNANPAIFQLYHGENYLICFQWNDDEVRSVLDQHA